MGGCCCSLCCVVVGPLLASLVLAFRAMSYRPSSCRLRFCLLRVVAIQSHPHVRSCLAALLATISLDWLAPSAVVVPMRHTWADLCIVRKQTCRETQERTPCSTLDTSSTDHVYQHTPFKSFYSGSSLSCRRCNGGQTLEQFGLADA